MEVSPNEKMDNVTSQKMLGSLPVGVAPERNPEVEAGVRTVRQLCVHQVCGIFTNKGKGCQGASK